MIRTKADVQTHYDCGERNPAVNVKVYASMSSVELPLDLGSSYPVGHPELIVHHKTEPNFTHEWIEEHTDEDDWTWFEIACESNFEMIQNDAAEIFSDYDVKVYREGRSGGWATVHGLPDIESWDAIMLGKWRRFAKLAREIADDVPRTMVDIIYCNVFEPWQEERLAEEASNAAAQLPIVGTE